MDNIKRYCYSGPDKNGEYPVTCDGARIGTLHHHRNEVYLAVEVTGIPVIGLGGLESLIKFTVHKEEEHHG